MNKTKNKVMHFGCRRMLDFLRQPNLLAAAVVATTLTACGGGGGTSNANSSAVAANNNAPTMLSFADVKGTDNSTTPAPLSEAEQAEVASLTRRWAADTLILRNGIGLGDAVIPSLYFARTQAIAAAASGTTLAQVRQVLPAPSTPAVSAALMRGIVRTISAAPSTQVTMDFMNDITASGQGRTWEKLIFNQISDADLAANRNLRLQISDEITSNTPWPASTTVTGVFQTDNGARLQTSMLKITGTIRQTDDNDMSAIALSLPQQRWLVRITPKKGIQAWKSNDLNLAIDRAVKAINNQAGQPAIVGDFLLPMLSISPTTTDGLEISDLSGMQEASDPVHADLRRLDGHGGTFVDSPSERAAISINEQGLYIDGASYLSFVFSPNNLHFGSGWTLVTSPLPLLPQCGATDLKPSYLALVNAMGGIDMLARFTSVTGELCANQ